MHYCTAYFELQHQSVQMRQSHHATYVLLVQDVVCGQMCSCVLHTADSFGNVLLHGGMVVQAYLSMQTPDDSQMAKVHLISLVA